MIPSEKIFGAFDSKRLLSEIATQRSINVLDENDDILPKAGIVKLLSEDIRDVGFSRMLLAIKLRELKSLGEVVAKERDEERVLGMKRVLQKNIKEHCDLVGQENFFNSVPPSIKKEIIKNLDIEMPDETREYTKAILREAEEIGQEHFFSSFSIENLAKFATSCGLDVDSLSQNVLVDCLMNLQSYKAPKKKPTPKPSKKKPEKIAKGITKIDLNSHFSKDELLDFIKANELPTTGNKRDLIARILAHVEGREIPTTRGKKRRKKKSENEKKADDKIRARENSSESSPKKKRTSSTKKKSETLSSSSEEESEKHKSKKKNK